MSTTVTHPSEYLTVTSREIIPRGVPLAPFFPIPLCSISNPLLAEAPMSISIFFVRWCDAVVNFVVAS